MNWIENVVANTLRMNCPFEYHVNDKAILGITKGLIRCNGQCPCSHEEWKEGIDEQDKLCPCITFRKTGECHCGLYVKDIIPSRE